MGGVNDSELSDSILKTYPSTSGGFMTPSDGSLCQVYCPINLTFSRWWENVGTRPMGF